MKGPTVQEALTWGINRLRESEVPDPRLSAEILLAEELGLDRLGLILAPDRGVGDSAWRSYQEKIRRRSGQEPIAYLTGKKEFWSLTFRVNPWVLIPRPETERLVETALSLSWPRSGPKTVVELGTGSGAVIISLLHSLPEGERWRGVATDVMPEVLAVARENALRHGVEGKIQWVVGDWLSPFSVKKRWIDLLLCNPPYVTEEEWTALPRSVKDFEPRWALQGGPDGLTAVRVILRQAADHLRNGGWLLLEIGENQGEGVQEAAKPYPFHSVEIIKDHAGKNRIWKACYHG